MTPSDVEERRHAISREDLLRIYEETKTIAVVGASADEAKPAHQIPRYLQSQGYRIIPVNPRGGEILGERAFRSLSDIDEAVARDATSIGPKVLWFQPGTHTQEAIRLATEAGLEVVAMRCMGPTHGQLGLGPGPPRPHHAAR